ncbi:MAG: NUDIX domain-containing protein [Bacteroidaceae bacterium]|nr:NUDIX domain-containing protein [Bacteroidaceae bacterium]
MPSEAFPSFRYCPVCGSMAFEAQDFKSRRCHDCGFEMFQNAAAAVVGVVMNPQGQLLVARRSRQPAIHTLDLPGGFVDKGEDLEQALTRELKEETGLILSPRQWLFSIPNIYRYSGLDVYTVDNFFLCQASGNVTLHPNDDVADLFWLPWKELRPDDFGLASIAQGVRRLQRTHAGLWPPTP